jgi:hypothetical protein
LLRGHKLIVRDNVLTARGRVVTSRGLNRISGGHKLIFETPTQTSGEAWSENLGDHILSSGLISNFPFFKFLGQR